MLRRTARILMKGVESEKIDSVQKTLRCVCVCAANNSNYKKDTMIRKEVHLNAPVMAELKRVIEDSEILKSALIPSFSLPLSSLTYGVPPALSLL